MRCAQASATVDKTAFRTELKRREAALTTEERQSSDVRLRERFLAEPVVRAVRSILLFAGMGAEVDTGPLLEHLARAGKQVLLPRCLPGHEMEARRYDAAKLVRHRYGMLEPAATCPVVERAAIDLILVPALCYDERCMRMGRGGGFYDRYLSGYTGHTIGLCRDALLCAAVPADSWDRPVELVLTETRRFVHESGR